MSKSRCCIDKLYEVVLGDVHEYGYESIFGQYGGIMRACELTWGILSDASKPNRTRNSRED